MNKELISVVVPAYNCAPWLGACLDSLLAQTYDNLEIVVVDDGSMDDTWQILTGYAARDSRIRPVHKENGGVTSARLRGIREAKGQWIGFVDGDDVLEPQMYGHLLGNAQEHGGQISHCGFQVNYPDGGIEYQHGTGILNVQDRQTALRDLLEEKIVEPSLCSKLFKRELFEGLEEKMDPSIKNNEDMLMNYYLFEQAEKAVFEDVCPYHYLIHPGSASRRKLNDHLIYDPIRVRQIILEHCTPDLKDDARRALARMCLVSYRQLVLEDPEEYRQDIQNVRTLIRQQLPFAGLLPKRNGMLVRLISHAPWVFDGLYRIVARLTGAGKE